jgi:putative MATE family efflux protein
LEAIGSRFDEIMTQILEEVQTQELILNDRIAARIVRLAYPVLIEQTLLYLVGFSDTVLTGYFLGEEHLAAVTNASYLLWMIGGLLAVVSVGGTALTARLHGANDHKSATRVCRQSIALAWVIGIVILVTGWTFAPIVISLMNLTGVAAVSATRFLRIILMVTPLLATTTAGVACLRGVGDTLTGMWVMIGVNLVNIALSWLLARGLGPIPSLGFAGIATGTACGEGLGGIAVLILLARGRSGLSLGLDGFFPNVRDSWRILRISLPAAGEGLTNSLCQLWFLGLINRLGPTATAAHGVAIRCEALAFLTLNAFAVAAATLTGMYLGAGRVDAARRAGRTAWVMGLATSAALAFFLYTQADFLFSMFLGGTKPRVAELGVPVLRIVSFALPALATINILSGSLRGAGDTRIPWGIVLFGYLIVRIPLTYYFVLTPSEGGVGLGLRGAWLAMFADLSTRGVLVAARFLGGRWIHTKV